MPDKILGGIIDKMRAAITDTTDFLLIIAGAGSSAAVVAVVKSWFPEQTATIADETLAMGVGFALFYFGDRIHPRLVPFGLGVFIASIGAFASEWIGSVILMLQKK